MSGDGPRKIGVTIHVSDELLNDWTRPDSDFDMAAWREEEKAKRLAIENFHVSALANSPHRAIVELHAPVFGDGSGASAECHGCDFGGYDGDHPDFPCRTYILAAGLPEDFCGWTSEWPSGVSR